MPKASQHLPHWRPQRLTALVLLAAILSAGALVGLGWVAGYGRVFDRLLHPHWLWVGVAVAGEFVAYLGYTAAYREVARAEKGAELATPKAAALVAAGFGVFVHGGGFALDRVALQQAGLSETEARRRVLGLGMLEYSVLAPAALVASVGVLLFHNSISLSLTVPWIAGVPIGAGAASATTMRSPGWAAACGLTAGRSAAFAPGAVGRAQMPRPTPRRQAPSTPVTTMRPGAGVLRGVSIRSGVIEDPIHSRVPRRSGQVPAAASDAE